MKTRTTKAAPQKPSTKSRTAVRGKYFNLLQEHGSNLVILDAALMPYFPDSASVNKALRAYLEIRASLEASGVQPRPRKKLDLPSDRELSFDPRTGNHPKSSSKSRKAA